MRRSMGFSIGFVGAFDAAVEGVFVDAEVDGDVAEAFCVGLVVGDCEC